MKATNTRSMTLTFENKVFLAIERLTGNHLISVVDEANKYCFKKFSGEVGTVDKKFIADRILAGLY